MLAQPVKIIAFVRGPKMRILREYGVYVGEMLRIRVWFGGYGDFIRVIGDSFVRNV